MSIKDNLQHILSTLPPAVTLIAVTKTHGVDKLQELYDAGHRLFGENKVQEMVDKYNDLPKDIQWHLIGHLQSNKVKFIAPFVKLIHSVDSFKLLQEINKQAQRHNRVIDCLLQVHIAKEETKFGFDASEIKPLLTSDELSQLSHICICGLMGMASNTEDQKQIQSEFQRLCDLFHSYESIKQKNVKFEILSMGMSSDYEIAVRTGSTMIRVGSSIFGKRA